MPLGVLLSLVALAGLLPSCQGSQLNSAGFAEATMVRAEALWTQITTADAGVSVDCAFIGEYDVNTSVETIAACTSQAILLKADTFDADPDGTACYFKRCEAYSQIRFTGAWGASNSYSNLVNAFLPLTRFEDGQGTACATVGEYVTMDSSAFHTECSTQAFLLNADTFDFSRTDGKCYFKKCGQVEGITFTAVNGPRDTYSNLGLEWTQLTRFEDGRGTDCSYVDSVDLVNESSYAVACQSIALLLGADTFDYEPGDHQCHFKRCGSLTELRYTTNFGAHVSYTSLRGTRWVQLTLASDGLGTDCSYISDYELPNASTFPAACYSQGAILGADTFDYQPDDHKCYFKRCGARSTIRFTDAYGPHASFTTLTEGWTHITRAEDGMGTSCVELEEAGPFDGSALPDKCFSHASFIGADTVDVRTADQKCFFKKCGSFADIGFMADYAADSYTVLYPRGNTEDDWGKCEAPECAELNLVFTSELRGLFTPADGSCIPCDPDESGSCFGGHARRMTYIKEQRAAFGNSTVVVNLGGDAFGPPFQDHPDYPSGAIAAEFVSALKYDFCVFSHSDFLVGIGDGQQEEHAQSFAARDCPYLVSNFQLKQDFASVNAKAERYKVVELNGGSKVGFVGFFPHANEYGFSYGVDVIDLDPRSAYQSLLRSELEGYSYEWSDIQEQLRESGAAFSTLRETLQTDAYLLSTRTPNDILQAAQELRENHPDVRAMVLICGKTYRRDQVDWLMEYGPFDVALLSMTPGDDDLTSKVIVPEGTTRQRVMAWSESTCLGMGRLRLRFDEQGNVTRYEHNADFALDNSVASDQALEQRLSELYEVTRLKRAQPYGSLSNPLTGTHRINEQPPSANQCYYTDCPAGEHVGRALLWKARSLGYAAEVSIANLGGYRQVLPSGSIGIVDCESTLSFRNPVQLYYISGNELFNGFRALITGEGERGFIGAGMRFAMHEPCWDFVDHTAYRDARNTGAPGSPEELEACLASGRVSNAEVQVTNAEVWQPAEDCQDYNTCAGEWVQLQKSKPYLIVTTTYVARTFLGTVTGTEINLGTDALSLCDYVAGNTPLQVEAWTAYRDRGLVQYQTAEEGWAAGNRIASVVSNYSYIDNLPNCPDGYRLDSETRQCVKCPPGYRSTADLSRLQCDRCPAGFFSGAEGASACVACSAGTFGAGDALTACTDCTAMQYSEPGAVVCVNCPQGTFGNTTGLSECPRCSAGRFANLVGQSACQDCPQGFMSTAGAAECIHCQRGQYGDSFGISECQTCQVGTYSSFLGQTACTPCGGSQNRTGAFWTTMRIQEINGRTAYTYFEGAKDSSYCGCDQGTWVSAENTTCHECGGGLRCPGLGQAFLEAGFAAEDASSVYECFQLPESCPGGFVGTCASGRRGTACAVCLDDMSPASDGECQPCSSGEKMLAGAVALLFMILLFLLYLKVDNDANYSAKESGASLVFASSCQQIMVTLQILAVISQAHIKWAEPLDGVFAAFAAFQIDLDAVKVGCAGQFSVVTKYILSLFMIGLALQFVGLYHVLVVLVKHKGRFREQHKVLVGAIGTVCMIFFISILSAILLCFQCDLHPNGKRTVSVYPSIHCWEPGDHVSMAVSSGVALILPLLFLAHCIHVVRVARAHLDSGNVQFMIKYNFLFSRFQSGTRWYSVFFLVRNSLVSLTPILASPSWQIVVIQLIMLVSLMVTCATNPWRARVVNYIDSVGSLSIIVILSLAGLQITESEDGVVVFVAMAGLFSLLFVLIAGMLYAIHLRMLQHLKQFQFFLCHHKAHAAAMARLLKMSLNKSNEVHRKVFIDSDDLKRVDLLFEYVLYHTETLVVLCTSEILTRPWCVGEVTSAMSKKVKCLSVQYHTFAHPTDQWLDGLTQQFDFTCLTEHGYSEQDVRAALVRFREVHKIIMPPLLNADALWTLQKSIIDDDSKGYSRGPSITASGSLKRRVSGQVSKFSLISLQAKRSMSKWSRPSGGSNAPKGSWADSLVFVGPDVTNPEALASGRIAGLLLAHHCQDNPELMPHMLVDLPCENDGHFAIPQHAKLYLLFCTENCFSEENYIRNIAEVMVSSCDVIPVVSSEVFRFPTPEFYQELQRRASEVFADTTTHPNDIIDYVQQTFKTIALVLSSHASSQLLHTQSEEIFKRMSMVILGDKNVRQVAHSTTTTIRTTSSKVSRETSKDGQTPVSSFKGGAAEPVVITSSATPAMQFEYEIFL